MLRLVCTVGLWASREKKDTSLAGVTLPVRFYRLESFRKTECPLGGFNRLLLLVRGRRPYQVGCEQIGMEWS